MDVLEIVPIIGIAIGVLLIVLSIISYCKDSKKNLNENEPVFSNNDTEILSGENNVDTFQDSLDIKNDRIEEVKIVKLNNDISNDTDDEVIENLFD